MAHLKNLNKLDSLVGFFNWQSCTTLSNRKNVCPLGLNYKAFGPLLLSIWAFIVKHLGLYCKAFWPFLFSYFILSLQQCDQIWRFFGLWATFESLWQQLICPNLPSFLSNFCKGVKIYHFSSEIIFRQLL